MSDSKDLIKIDDKNQLPAELQDRLDKESAENLEGVQPRLPKIQMPTGKGKDYTLEVPGEDDEQRKELDGIILYQTPSKAYWSEPFGGASAQVVPDCASHNGIEPSDQYPNVQAEQCAACQHNRFGTAKDATGGSAPGKACRDVKRIVLLLRDRMDLPFILTVPPTGLRSVDDFLVRLRREKRPYWSVLTRLSLVTEVNKKGIEYPMVKPDVAGYINDPDSLERMMNSRKEWVELLKTTLFSNLEFAANGHGPEEGDLPPKDETYTPGESIDPEKIEF